MATIHLANEIIESQKVRSDLLKWKIISVATIASIGLGISSNHDKFELAICVIPFVMAYIDVLCTHINLRIYTISRWHKTNKESVSVEAKYMQEYEKFTEKARGAGAYNLEGWTIQYSSFLVNLLLISVAFAGYKEDIFNYKYYILTSGFIGIIIAILIEIYLRKTRAKIDML